MEIATIEDLLGYAAKVEDDAAAHLDDLAKATEASGNADVGVLFRQLAGQSRHRAAEAMAKAGPISAAKEVPADYAWPTHATPDSTALWAGDASLSRMDGLRAALQGENRAYEFYCAGEATTKSADVAKTAKALVKAQAERIKVHRSLDHARRMGGQANRSARGLLSALEAGRASGPASPADKTRDWSKIHMLKSVEEFLAYAVRLEREAADRFAQLADAMKSCGNSKSASCFEGFPTFRGCISQRLRPDRATVTSPSWGRTTSNGRISRALKPRLSGRPTR